MRTVISTAREHDAHMASFFNGHDSVSHLEKYPNVRISASYMESESGGEDE